MAESGFGKRLILATFAVVMGAALALSMSRGALAAMAATAVVAAAVAIRRPAGRRALAVVVPVLLAILGLSLWCDSDALRARLASAGPESDSLADRLAIWRTTVPLAADYPLTGSGLGTFEFSHPAYADTYLATRRAVHAHNEYLEGIAELGLVGAALLAALGAAYVVQLAKAWKRRRSRTLAWWAAGCLLAALPILVHAGTDFGLHIPAVGLMLAALLGLALALARMAADGEADVGYALARTPASRATSAHGAWKQALSGPGVRRVHRGLALLAATAVIGLLVWPAADLAAWAEARGADGGPAATGSADAFTRALAWTPADPALHHARAVAVRADLVADCRRRAAETIGTLVGAAHGLRASRDTHIEASGGTPGGGTDRGVNAVGGLRHGLAGPGSVGGGWSVASGSTGRGHCGCRRGPRGLPRSGGLLPHAG